MGCSVVQSWHKHVLHMSYERERGKNRTLLQNNMPKQISLYVRHKTQFAPRESRKGNSF